MRTQGRILSLRTVYCEHNAHPGAHLFIANRLLRTHCAPGGASSREQQPVGRGHGGGLDIDTSFDRRPLVSPVITNNLFERNRAATNGGGLTIADASVTLLGNVFKQNEAVYDGGAVYLVMGEPGTAQFVNNEFWGNIAGDHGGAIEAGQQGCQSPPLLIQGNLFISNEAHGLDTPQGPDTGGAISLRGWSGTVANNTFVGNIGTGISNCSGG
jgi:hypothetical protein